MFLHDNHFDVITSMPAFVARKKYCHTCKKGYDHVRSHLCGDTCKLCYFQNCPIVSWTPCSDCNRIFKSQECFDRHKQNVGNAKSICLSTAKCPHCHLVFDRTRLRPDLHHCGLKRCSTCEKYVGIEDHQCYMQPVKEKPAREMRTSTKADTTNYCSSILSASKRMVLTNPTCA